MGSHGTEPSLRSQLVARNHLRLEPRNSDGDDEDKQAEEEVTDDDQEGEGKNG